MPPRLRELAALLRRNWRVVLALTLFLGLWWLQRLGFVPQPRAVIRGIDRLMPRAFSPDGSTFVAVYGGGIPQLFWFDSRTGDVLKKHRLADEAFIRETLIDFEHGRVGCVLDGRADASVDLLESSEFLLFDLTNGASLLPEGTRLRFQHVFDANRSSDGRLWVVSGIHGPNSVTTTFVLDLEKQQVRDAAKDLGQRRLLQANGHRLVFLTAGAELRAAELADLSKSAKLEQGELAAASARWDTDGCCWRLQGDSLRLAMLRSIGGGRAGLELSIREWSVSTGQLLAAQELPGPWRIADVAGLFFRDTPNGCECCDALAGVRTIVPLFGTDTFDYGSVTAFNERETLFFECRRVEQPFPLPERLLDFLKLRKQVRYEDWVEAYERGTGRYLDRVPRACVLLMDPPGRQVITRNDAGELEIWDFPTSVPPHARHLFLAGLPALALLVLFSFAPTRRNSATDRYPVRHALLKPATPEGATEAGITASEATAGKADPSPAVPSSTASSTLRRPDSAG